ncbi:MAG: hypothetical protein Q9173_001355 [Seirophora scorigena]
MSSRAFSTTAAKYVGKWLGYSLDLLPSHWQSALQKYTAPGGGAEARLGNIDSVEIKSRDEGPVHKSHYNPKDKADIISIRVSGEKGIKTCHVYENGLGTADQGEDPS